MQAGSRTSLNRATEIKETEAQSRFVNERVSQIEAYFGDLCTEFISYTRRTAKLRNNGDELSKILLNYSVNEKINRSSANMLKKFAQLLSTIEDYRHAEIDRLFAKVITPLSTYGEEVKRVRSNIKAETAARKKEVSQIKRLGREHTRALEDRLHMATMDATRSADALERHVIQFEAKKIKGLKVILTDFVHIEMLWHAKALETLTEAFNVVQSMQEEADLADFRNTLFRSGTLANLSSAGGDHFQTSQTSLDASKSRSVPALNSTTTGAPRGGGGGRQHAAATTSRQTAGGRDNRRENFNHKRSHPKHSDEEDADSEELSEENSNNDDDDDDDDNDDDESEEEDGDDSEDQEDEDEEEEEEGSDDDVGSEEGSEETRGEDENETERQRRHQLHKPPAVSSATPLKSALKQSPKRPLRAR